jgi:hypothetical protein
MLAYDDSATLKVICTSIPWGADGVPPTEVNPVEQHGHRGSDAIQEAPERRAARNASPPCTLIEPAPCAGLPPV